MNELIQFSVRFLIGYIVLFAVVILLIKVLIPFREVTKSDKDKSPLGS